MTGYNDPTGGNRVLQFGPPVTGAVKVMLILCPIVTLAIAAWPQLLFTLGLVANQFRPWQLITSVFTHIRISHLAFNCFGIWIFGSHLQATWGVKKFVVFFLTTSTLANVFWLFYVWFISGEGIAITVGASGGIFALLYAYAYFWPNNTLLAFWLFPVRAVTFVYCFGFLELYFALIDRGAQTNHLVHLSGLVIAAVWLDYTCNGRGTTWLRKTYSELIFRRRTRHLTVIEGGFHDSQGKEDKEKKDPVIN